MRTLLSVAVSSGLLACTSQSPHVESAASSATAVATTAAPSAVASTSSAVPPDLAASAAPSSAPVATASASSAPVVETPLPKVEVKFYGLHVGGGKNDKAEHAPIISSISAHTDDFRRCFAKVEDPKKGGTFGIQLIIPGEGGKADVSHPKNGLKGDAFKDCMVAVYQGIDFEKPLGGVKTNATYSLKFTPEK